VPAPPPAPAQSAVPPIRSAAGKAALLPPDVDALGPHAPPLAVAADTFKSGKSGADVLMRPRRRKGPPAWTWGILAAGAAVVVGLSLYAANRPDGSPTETAAADGSDAKKEKAGKQAGAGTEATGADSKNLKSGAEKSEGPQKPPGDAPGAPQRLKVAKSLDDAEKAVVKFQVPVPGSRATSSGTGFFFNERGWIATNHHVVSQATTATRVVMFNGAQYELAGVIAEDPARDLAILKLIERPERIMMLDIGYQGNPPLGTKVYAFGHPYNLDSSLSEGIVSQVRTTSELLEHRNPQLASQIHTPADHLWIQHSAKILPGNSGGPLFTEDGRVVGINTFIHAEYGFASHVKYLRQMAEKAVDKVRPLPPGPAAPGPGPIARPWPGAQPPEGEPSGPAPPDPGRMQQLYSQCVALKWKPAEAKQYEAFSELAKLLTAAKQLQLHPEDRGNLPPAAVEDLVKSANELADKIRQVEFNADQVRAISRFAAEGIDKVGAGAMAFCTVVGNGDNGLLLEIAGTEKRVWVSTSAEAAKSPGGSRWLVIGVLGDAAKLRDDQAHTYEVRQLLSYHLLPMK